MLHTCIFAFGERSLFVLDRQQSPHQLVSVRHVVIVVIAEQVRISVLQETVDALVTHLNAKTLTILSQSPLVVEYLILQILNISCDGERTGDAFAICIHNFVCDLFDFKLHSAKVVVVEITSAAF